MKCLVLSGGRHAYQKSTLNLGAFLRTSGHEVSLTENASVLAHGVEMDAAIKGVEGLFFT